MHYKPFTDRALFVYKTYSVYCYTWRDVIIRMHGSMISLIPTYVYPSAQVITFVVGLSYPLLSPYAVVTFIDWLPSRINRPMAGISMTTNAFDCGIQCFVKKLCSFQTSVHLIVVSGGRLLADFFNALLSKLEPKKKKNKEVAINKQTNKQTNKQ